MPCSNSDIPAPSVDCACADATFIGLRTEAELLLMEETLYHLTLTKSQYHHHVSLSVLSTEVLWVRLLCRKEFKLKVVGLCAHEAP